MATRWLSEAELRARYGTARIDQLADHDGDALPDAGVVEGWILAAESYAESHLLARYQPEELPATGAASKRFRGILEQIAYWNAHELHQVKGDDVRDAMRTAQSELAAIVRGGASLLVDGAPAVDLSAPRVIAVPLEGKGTFSADALKDW